MQIFGPARARCVHVGRTGQTQLGQLSECRGPYLAGAGHGNFVGRDRLQVDAFAARLGRDPLLLLLLVGRAARGRFEQTRDQIGGRAGRALLESRPALVLRCATERFGFEVGGMGDKF